MSAKPEAGRDPRKQFTELILRCNIQTKRKWAGTALGKLYSDTFADGCDPIAYKCLDCGLEWGTSPLDDWREKTCSNCYSERLAITKVRLEYDNWGAQNGGRDEMEKRMAVAIKMGAVPYAD